MGNFYVNTVLKGAALPDVERVVDELGRPAFLLEAPKDMVILYDSQGEDQDAVSITETTAQLSERLGCIAWSVLNHDDDILWYVLYDRGEKKDEYNSAPDYFSEGEGEPAGPEGGDAHSLATAFDAAESEEIIRKALQTPGLTDDRYLFALHRHEDLAKAIGLTPEAVALGYGYITEGDTPDIEASQFIRVGS